MWTLGDRNIMVTVNEFAGKTRVHIRQYFNPDPINTPLNLVPTKKGIALTLTEWEALKEHVMEVDRALKGGEQQQPSYYNPTTTDYYKDY